MPMRVAKPSARSIAIVALACMSLAGALFSYSVVSANTVTGDYTAFTVTFPDGSTLRVSNISGSAYWYNNQGSYTTATSLLFAIRAGSTGQYYQSNPPGTWVACDNGVTATIFAQYWPPSAPTITPVGSCIINQPFSIHVSSTDPQGASIEYQAALDGTATIDQISQNNGSGSTATLSWTYYTAGSYTIYVFAQDSYTYVSAVSHYTFSCYPPPAPTCTISINPNPITSGAWSTVSWSTSGSVTSMTVNGSSVGYPTGYWNVNPSSTTVYNGSVSGPGGTGSCSNTLTVNPPANCTFYSSDAGNIAVNNGQTIYPYSGPHVPYGSQCSSIQQSCTCNNGSLPCSYKYYYCSPLTSNCPTSASLSGDSNGFTIFSGVTNRLINKLGFNFCVSNNGSGGRNYFIPARTSTELQSFYNAAPSLPGVTRFSP